MGITNANLDELIKAVIKPKIKSSGIIIFTPYGVIRRGTAGNSGNKKAIKLWNSQLKKARI